jgi:hypothetical protein
MAASIRIEPRSWFSRHIDLRCNGRSLGSMELSFLCDQGSATVEGVRFELEHPTFFGRDYTMRRGDQVIAAARADRWLRASYPFDYAGQSYRIARRAFWSHTLDLRDAPGEILGSIIPDGLLSRSATAYLPETLPLELRVFAIWIALVSWRQFRRRS